MRLPSVSPIERAAAYRAAFPRYRPLAADDRWLDGVFVMGNLYAGNGFYGAYPPGYLPRVQALFPEVWRPREGRAPARPQPGVRVLHAFSGSLRRLEAPGTVRIDLRRDRRRRPTVQGDARRLPFGDATFDHVLADTPYGPADAERYGTEMPSRRLVLWELHRVVKPGGHLVWLDEVLPMFAKRAWRWWGVIGMTTGTNRRGRFIFIFERVERGLTTWLRQRPHRRRLRALRRGKSS